MYYCGFPRNQRNVHRPLLRTVAGEVFRLAKLHLSGLPYVSVVEEKTRWHGTVQVVLSAHWSFTRHFQRKLVSRLGTEADNVILILWGPRRDIELAYEKNARNIAVKGTSV